MGTRMVDHCPRGRLHPTLSQIPSETIAKVPTRKRAWPSFSRAPCSAEADITLADVTGCVEWLCDGPLHG